VSDVKEPIIAKGRLSESFNLVFKVAILCAVGYWLVVLTKGQDKQREALNETIGQMKDLGNGIVQARGYIETQAELERKAREAMGNDFLKEIRATNGNIVTLATAVGELKATVVYLKEVGGVKRPDGSFSTSAPIQQDRAGAPPLTSIGLRYDASKSTLTEALAGSRWENHKEVFKINFADWRTEHDGLRSALSLKREVYKDDNKTIKLGEETINLGQVDAFYSQNEVLKLSASPKYTIFVGGSVDGQTGRTRPAFYIEKKLTRSTGVTSGYVNGGYFLGGSWSFGKQ